VNTAEGLTTVEIKAHHGKDYNIPAEVRLDKMPGVTVEKLCRK
jgi:hypothetical protein